MSISIINPKAKIDFKFMRFINRQQAALQLALVLRQYKGKRVIVYAVPRGGVVLGAIIAQQLNADLDLVIPRKIGHPANPEYAIAAVSEGGEIVSGKEDLSYIIQQGFLKEAVKAELDEARRRRRLYLGKRKPLRAQGRICLLVDDGMATGLTMKASVLDLRQKKAERIVVAVPVASAEAVSELTNLADEVVALYVPAKFFGTIGAYYGEFEQLSDRKVIEWINIGKST